MTRLGLAMCALLLAVAACGGSSEAPEPPPPAPAPESSDQSEPDSTDAEPDDVLVLTQDGLDELDLGERGTLSLSVGDVESWLGEALSPRPQTGDCSLVTNEDLDLALITDEYNGVLGFVLEDPDVVTPEGIHVGSTFDELDEAYGDAIGIVEGAQSQTGGPLALVDDRDDPGAPPSATSRHLAFDTDTDGTVTRLKGGYWPWMGYPDYCEVASDSPQDTGWPLTGA